MNELMMQLIEEEVNPEEIFLEDIVEEAVEAEEETIFGSAEIDDDVIEFINSGMKLGYNDPIDFTDAEVDTAVFDDLIDDNDD